MSTDPSEATTFKPRSVLAGLPESRRQLGEGDLLNWLVSNPDDPMPPVAPSVIYQLEHARSDCPRTIESRPMATRIARSHHGD